MNNLTLRIISSIVLIPLVLYLSLYSPKEYFWGFLLVVGGIFISEFVKLTKLPIIISVFFIGFLLFSSTFEVNIFFPIIILSVVFWVLNIFLVIKYPQFKIQNNIYKTIALLLLVSSFIPLFLLREDTTLLLLLFLIVWGADSFAYIFGKLFGKHKLAPNLSGGKTIEGVLGGMLASVVLTVVWLKFTNFDNYLFLLLAVIVALFSVVGDLYQSIYKREAGADDSGNIIPGHGGVWDRVDGLIAASPIFYIGVAILL